MERPLSLNAVSKKYDEAFKRQAVEMVLRGGKTVKQAAEELGVSQYSIYEWKRKFFPLSCSAGMERRQFLRGVCASAFSPRDWLVADQVL
jgi:transposase